jgi:hypothetical protein
MGARLVREVIRTMPATIKPTERLLIILLAADLPDSTREGQYADGRSVTGLDALRRDLGGLSATGVRALLQRLASIGFEMRVPISKDGTGRLGYVAPGRPTTYRIPQFGPEKDTLF